IKKIAIICALDIEANPIIKELNLNIISNDEELAKKFWPMQVYKNKINNIYLILFGEIKHLDNKVQRVGVQAASIAIWEILKSIKPNIIINSGTCGGITQINKEIDNKIVLPKTKDVYFGNNIYYSDRRIPLEPWSKGWTIGNYKCISHPNLLNYIN